MSQWALRNPWQARLTIVTTKVVLVLLAMLCGLVFQEIHWLITAGIVFIFAGACLHYPARRDRSDYVQRKVLDVMLCLSSFGLVMVVANQRAHTLTQAPAPAVELNSARVIPVVNTLSDTKQWKKQQRKIRKQQRKILKQRIIAAVRQARNDLSPGARVVLAILAVCVLLLGVAGVGAWSCNLTCSGMDGAAALVALGGFTALVFLGILMFRGIFGRRKKTAEPTG